LNDEEVALSGRLNVLSDALELGPSDRAHWAELIEEEKVRVGFMAHLSQEIVDAGKSIGVEVDRESLHDMQSPNTTAAWCTAAHLE
jgi:hypothetical protein